jgi:hypothetical protein
MTGHRHWHLDRHILVYIGCQFEAYLSRNNWQLNLNPSTEWKDRQKYKKNNWPLALANGPAIGLAPTGNALNPSRL